MYGFLITALCEKKKKDGPSPQSEESCEIGSLKYFLLCGLGGLISCGTTHTSLVPLDLVKCRIQVNKAKYKNIFRGFGITIKEEGYKGLTKGWLPTFFGYSIQGTFKFGFYEVFKVYYKKLIGEENAYIYRTALFLCSSASAEILADIGLCPFESIKVKIQTVPGFPRSLTAAAGRMHAEEGFMAFYKSLPPLWMRQIPYTMMKFTSFEKTVELLYIHVVPRPRAECSKGEQLIVTFVGGYIAGVFCAIVSHPADTLLSHMNQHKDMSAAGVVRLLGFCGLWGGLIPRIVMIGTLTALQWFIYDGFKVSMRLPRPPPPEMPESLKKKVKKD